MLKEDEMLTFHGRIPSRSPGTMPGGAPGHPRHRHLTSPLLGLDEPVVPGDARSGAELCVGKGWVISGKIIRKRLI